MQYEEYRDRMVAQGRTPLPREHYASQVEAGYMLANLTMDEFCQLPDRAIAELSRAANRLDVHDRRADDAARECDRLCARVAVLETIEEERDAARDAVLNEAGRLRDKLAERDALIERLQAMTVEQTRRAGGGLTMRDDHMSNAEAIGILARMISTRAASLDEITALRIGMRRTERRIVDLARNKVHRRERFAAREAEEPAPEVEG